jgi:predicted membrane-bound mannosyltransferase
MEAFLGAVVPKEREARRGPTLETILYLVILLAAIVTRFALLDSQALHHDEGIHALYGWNIYTGKGWTHDAVYHGPVIYHMEALSFMLFGDSDATTRVMFAITSIATCMLPVLLRRELGRWGALLASFLFLISPSFLYFGRFGHPDVFGAFFTLLLFVCIVRYMANHKVGWLYGAVAAMCMHFSAKPTAYIVTAVFLLFLAGRVLWQRYDLHALWPLVGLGPLALEGLWKAAIPAPFPLADVFLGLSLFSVVPVVLAGLAALGMLAWHWLDHRLGSRKREPSATLDLLVALGTMVLPLLSAVPLNVLLNLQGLSIDYHVAEIAQPVLVTAMVVIVGCFLISAIIGLVWNPRRWLVSAGIFWGIFFILHTSFFSSMTGWATGLVQTLGFWLTQQDVMRIHVGPQYYLMLMAVYETVVFLFGTIGAALFAWRSMIANPARRGRPRPPKEETAPEAPLVAAPGAAMGLLALWAPAVFLLYSFAGEQVPWLNVHPTLPFVLLTGALIGRVITFRPRLPNPGTLRRWADVTLLAVAAVLLLWAGRPVLGSGGGEIAIWLASAAILLGLAYLAFSGHARWGEAPFLVLGAVVGLMTVINASRLSFGPTAAGWADTLYREWAATLYVPLALAGLALIVRTILLGKTALRSGALLLFAFLCVYGAGSAFRVTYINNDTPTEMLIYVQTSSDLQWAVDELATLSTLTTGGKDMAFLYDSEVAWPLEWYLRDYPHKIYQPTISGPPPADATMALVYRDKENTSAPYLEGRFVPTRYYAFNWWFPEDTYRDARTFVTRMAPEILEGRGLEKVGIGIVRELVRQRPDLGGGGRKIGLGDVIVSLTLPTGQAHAWRYFLFREPPAPLGAREFAVYVRNDLVAPLERLKDSIRRR